MRHAVTGIWTVLALALPAGQAGAQSLAETLDLAERTNPRLESGRTGAELAREALQEARAQGHTRVSVGASAGFESIESNRPFNQQVGERPVASAQVEASRPIYTGGRVRAGVRAAEAGIDAADLRLEALRQQVYFAAISAHIDVQTGIETVSIRESNVGLLREQSEAANARFNVGFITRTDVALTEARLASSLAGLAAAQASLERVRADYQAVTGQLPGQLGVLPPAPRLPASFDEALVLALENNPELQAGREQVRAAGEAIRIAEAGGRPQVSIVGSAGTQRDFDESFEDNSAQVFARGSVPLWQGGLVRSQVRTAILEREQAVLQVQATERDIQAGLASAWYGHIAAQRSIEASQRQLEAAEIAFEGARQELAVGTRTTLDVLNAEQDLLNARLSLVNAEREERLAAYQILQLTGQLTLDAVLTP